MPRLDEMQMRKGHNKAAQNSLCVSSRHVIDELDLSPEPCASRHLDYRLTHQNIT